MWSILDTASCQLCGFCGPALHKARSSACQSKGSPSESGGWLPLSSPQAIHAVRSLGRLVVAARGDPTVPRKAIFARESISTSPLRSRRARATGTLTADAGRRSTPILPPMERSCVVFIDMLGFAALTEEAETLGHTFMGEDVFELLDRRGPIHLRMMEASSLTFPGNRLAAKFSQFHFVLDSALAALSRTRFWSISFSDSAFVSLPTFSDALTFSADVMRNMLDWRVPVRVGIGYGTFLVVRFKSDRSLTAGIHASQFLGTAVVRAHSAEQAGVSGMRILLHPSVRHLCERSDLKPLVLPVVDAIHSDRVYAELNYLLGAGGGALEAWTQILSMRARVPSSERRHYDSTLLAINRMLEQRNCFPFKLPKDD